MNGYEALAYLSKSPDNKVYRDSWVDGTKWVSMTKGGKILFPDGSLSDCGSVIFGIINGKGGLDEGWHIYEETYTLSQAIDKVIEGKGSVEAHHPKDHEKIWYDEEECTLQFSFDTLFADELASWTLKTVAKVDDDCPF